MMLRNLFWLLFFILLFVFTFGGGVGAVVFGDALAIRWNQAAMKSPKVYEPVARELALLCQTTPKELASGSGMARNGWMPKAVRDRGPNYGLLSDRGARVEMGGGFYHYGYILQPDDEASTADTRVWQLRMYYESGGSELLATVELGPDERLSDEEFVRRLSLGYVELAEETPGEMNIYREHFYLLLDLGFREEARQVCRRAALAVPGHWWPQLAASLMDSGDGNLGARRFEAWVAANPSFSNHVYLCYVRDVLGGGDGVCQTVAAAVRFPLGPGPDDDVNHWALAYTAMRIAIKHDCHRDAIALADKVLTEDQAHNPFHFDVVAAKAAAVALAGEAEPALAILEGAPVEDGNLRFRDLSAEAERLAVAIRDNVPDRIRAALRDRHGFQPFGGLPVDAVCGRD